MKDEIHIESEFEHRQNIDVLKSEFMILRLIKFHRFFESRRNTQDQGTGFPSLARDGNFL